MATEHVPVSNQSKVAGLTADSPSCPAPAMSFPGAYVLMTRQDVCRVLGGISLRTLENWVRQEKVPAPHVVGGRRLWHPERCYGELNAKLLEQHQGGAGAIATTAKPQGVKKEQAVTHPAARGTLSRSASACEEMKRRASGQAG